MPGEFAFIEKIRAEAARHAASDVGLVLGIGDDAAVWHPRAEYENLITVDLLVEEMGPQMPQGLSGVEARQAWMYSRASAR